MGFLSQNERLLNCFAVIFICKYGNGKQDYYSQHAYCVQQGWLQGYVTGGGGNKFDQLASVDVEVWPTRVGQCWGLTDSSQSMLRFDWLKSVGVEVWPARVGQCWGLTNSNRSMLRHDGQCWGLINSNSFIKQNISVGHFWWSNSVRVWPTQSATLGGGEY